jgi:hypothetical protein
MQQVEAVLAEKAGAELCDVTIDLTAGKFTITNNLESRTGYPNVWSF